MIFITLRFAQRDRRAGVRSKNQNTMKVFFLLITNILLSNAVFSQQELINALALSNGAYIAKAPSSYSRSSATAMAVTGWSPEALIDGTISKGWCSSGITFPYEFVIELPEIYVIEKLGFNNQCEKKLPGICTKDIKIEFSIQGADVGYTEAYKGKLADYAGDTSMTIKPQKARWIKISVLSNYGYSKCVELMEMRAWGKYASAEIKPFDLSGSWETNWGNACLAQSGTSVSGNYEHNSGEFSFGGIDRRVATFKWNESTGKSGRTVLVLNEEGTRLTGIWCYGNDLTKYGFWVFKKKSNEACLQKSTDAVMSEKLKKELDEQGKLIFYGINFETNSATLKLESEPVLKQIINLLNANSTLKINIEGHTDNTGEEMYNQELSEKRASAVKDYLVKNKIAIGRITAIGKGEKFPIAENSTELGKSANRRVEISSRTN